MKKMLKMEGHDGTCFYKGPTCAVYSEQYGNCPEPIAWAVNLNGNNFYLCERCYVRTRQMVLENPKRYSVLAAIDLCDSEE